MNSSLAFQYYMSSVFFFGRVFPLHRGVWLAVPAAALLAAVLLLPLHRLHNSRGVKAPALLLSAVLATGLASLSLYCFTQFIHICVLPQLSPWVFAAVFGAVALWGGSKQLGVLERFSALTAAVVAGLLLLANLSGAMKLHFLSGTDFYTAREYFDISRDWLLSSLLFFFFLYLAEGFVLHTAVSFNKKVPWPYWKIARGQLLSTLLISLTYGITVSALGPAVFEALTYPVYYPAGLSFTAEYLDRIEIILLAVFFLTEFVKLSLLFNHIKAALATIGPAGFSRKKKES